MNIEVIAKAYLDGHINASDVYNGVVSGKLTASEYFSITGQEIELTDGTRERIYKNLCAKKIAEKYSPSEEQAIKTDTINALLANEPTPEKYLTFLADIEAIKDVVHMEVFNVERA
jgi:hypothetical protein